MATATSKTQARLRREADEKFREAFDTYMFECLQQKGQKLPTENALAEKFGVTRYKVRKEMERLNQAGVLQRVKHGGTTVTQVTPTDFAQRLDMQFRVAHFSAATYAQTTDCLLTGIVPLWLEVLKGDDTDAIKSATEELTQMFYQMSEKLYQQANPQGAQGGAQAGPDMGGQQAGGAQDGQYYDADYKVVDDDDQNKK